MVKSLVPFGAPTGMFYNFRKEMDQMFDRFFTGDNGGASENAMTWNPRLNLSETENAYEVSVDLPGLKPEEVSVELRNGDLWITGERKSQAESKDKTWHRVESFYGEFRRGVRLGDDVCAENVNAEFHDGVLKIHVPKTEKAQSQKIEIKA